MVWNSSVFNNCAYEKLEFTGNWSLEYANILVNGANYLILQPTQIKICKNVTAFETSEGLAIVGEFKPFLKDQTEQKQCPVNWRSITGYN